jgi:hypothetical protein
MEIDIGYMRKKGSKEDYKEQWVFDCPVHFLEGLQISKIVQAAYARRYGVAPSKTKTCG